MFGVGGGKPQLSAITKDGLDVIPVGGLSQGTIDQLYLSLRIAAVEDAIASGLKLPFLADDLFINFDDARSEAVFCVLGELATKTQVLFFTHHDHLISVAERTLPDCNLSRCEIS
ncbi:MAG: ATP-binding protein [Caulobacter sp.]